MAERRAAAVGRVEVGRTRGVALVRIYKLWSQPGLCDASEQALEARASMETRFRRQEQEDGTIWRIDPRLPEDAHLPLLEYIVDAERKVAIELNMKQARPNVYVYADDELLQAAACTNDDVVAYYDGALHVAVNRPDVRESVIHEYTHHALMSSGFWGPTWAQEGIAMLIARESWWREPQWLTKVLSQPLDLELMERGIPYTLDSEQAVLFHAQAASMVACAARDHDKGFEGLVAELRSFVEPGGAPSYVLPAPAEDAELSACIQTWLLL